MVLQIISWNKFFVVVHDSPVSEDVKGLECVLGGQGLRVFLGCCFHVCGVSLGGAHRHGHEVAHDSPVSQGVKGLGCV